MATILIALGSLIVLISLHELGHFLTAKKFGIRVEEFGLGYPPRLFGKKIGETIYSVNLLPFGAFVRIPEQNDNDPAGFTNKPLWQRMLVIFNGGLSFWLVAMVLFAIVFAIGAPVAISDSETGFQNISVMVTAVAPNGPAHEAGIKPGDQIREFLIFNDQFLITTVAGFQDLTDQYKGKEVVLTIQRGNEVLEVNLVPREAPPAGQGPIGINLARVGIKAYPWYLAAFEGIKEAFVMTGQVVMAYIDVFARIFHHQPTGLSLMGPVGIVGMLGQGLQIGAVYFLQMIGALAIQAALINFLPIPAFDGGKLLFLGIEAIRRKPVSRKWEERITGFFFILLIVLMIFVSIKDIKGLF